MIPPRTDSCGHLRRRERARGIQFQDWNEIIAGILLSLEQTENYERARGPEGNRDDWHDRNVGIDDAVAKGVDKWMPEELIALAQQKAKR